MFKFSKHTFNKEKKNGTGMENSCLTGNKAMEKGKLDFRLRGNDRE
jgi:hypothetical protein